MFTELEEIRVRKETEVAKRIKGRIKSRQTDLASNLFPRCSPQPGTHKRFTELGREEKGEGGDRGDLVGKMESQTWETAIKPVITFPSKNGY